MFSDPRFQAVALTAQCDDTDKLGFETQSVNLFQLTRCRRRRAAVPFLTIVAGFLIIFAATPSAGTTNALVLGPDLSDAGEFASTTFVRRTSGRS
jgi:hypothetical protein